MQGGVDAEGRERAQVELLDIGRRGLEDHLELEVATETEGVFAVAGVPRAARRLDEGDPVGLRPEDAEKGLRVHGAGPDLDVIGLLHDAAMLAPEAREREDQGLQVHSGTPRAGRGAASEGGG